MGSIVNGIAVARRLRQAVRVDVPDLQRLHAPGGAAVGADGAAGRLGVDARLGRPRRGRPDPPAGRDVRGAARDPAPLVHPARPTRTRRPSPGRSRSSGPTARSRSRSRGRRCRRSTATSSRRPRALERGAYTLWESSPVAGPDPDRDRRGGRADARRRPPARGRRHGGARRLDAVLGAVRGAAGRVPRRGAAAGGQGAALGRAGCRARLEAVGRRPGDSISIEHFGASAPGATVLEEFGFNLDNVVARAAALLERVA